MSPYILLFGALMLIIVIGLFMIGRNNRSSSNLQQSFKQQPSDSGTRAEQLALLKSRLQRRDELLNLLQRDQKINAIKLFREDTGASLKDAKDAVDSIIAESRLTRLPGAISSLAQPVQPVTADVSAPGLDEAVLASIMVHLRNRQKINAIKVYRQYTGASLKDAKNAVEALEAML